MEGKRLGHYELRELLGKGGMGEVWLARDHKLERDVALKFLHPGLGLDDEAEERLLREARAASALDHPGILTIHAIEREEGRTFIVMERLLGATIAEGAARLQADAAAARIEQAADALAAAHARGIIHRDIKPTNLFVDGRGRVVVMDFGLARVLNAPELTRSGTTVGTLGYMAPEQLKGQEATASSDVFGLGAVLYELLAGRPAFDHGQGPGGVIHSILEEEPAALPDVPPELDAVLTKALAKSAVERYANAEELRDAIRSARIAMVQGGDPSGSEAARSPWRKIAAGSLIAFAVLSLALWKSQGRGADPGLNTGDGPTEIASTWRQHDVGILSVRVETPRIAPDGQSLVFVERGSGLPQVYITTILDPSPRALTDASSFPEGAMAPAWAPDGKSVLVESLAGKSPSGDAPIFTVPILGGEPRLVVELGKSPSYGTGNLIIYERSYAVWIHDLERGESSRAVPVTETTSVGFGVHPAMDPSGERIAYVKSLLGPLGVIKILDRRTGESLVLVRDRATHTGLTFTPDGTKLLFSSDMGGAANLWRLDLASGARERLTTGAGDDISPSMAGGRILYQNRRDDHELVRFDPASKSEEVLFRSRSPIFGARFSPSGEDLLFSTQVGGSAEACVLTPGDRAPRRITQSADALYIFPRWLGESSILCYRDTEAGSDLIRVDTATGEESVIVPGWSMQTHPYAEPSPDGSRIAIFQTAPDTATLVFDTESGSEGASRYPCFMARWSPDGEWLTAQSFNGELLTAPSSGEWRPKILGPGQAPTFSPVDGSIVFADVSSSAGPALARYAPGDEEPERLGDIGDTIPGLTSFDIDAEGRVVYVRFVRRTSEAWLLEQTQR